MWAQQPAGTCTGGAVLVAPDTWRNCRAHHGPASFLCFKCNRQLLARFLVPIHLYVRLQENIWENRSHKMTLPFLRAQLLFH